MKLARKGPNLLLSLAMLALLNGNIVSAKARIQAETVMTGGTVIDGTGRPPIKDAVVLIRGNRIIRVGPRGKIKYSRTAHIIDVAGKYLLPGLIDIHVHYNDWMGEMFLANGVTTVKDVGNYVEWISVVSEEVEQGKVRGPRIFYVGNGLDSPPPKRDHFIGLESPQMAKQVVKLLHERGAVGIKVRERLTRELLRAITEEAHRLQIAVTGHIRRVNAYDAALDGIDGLEHASGIVQATADAGAKIDLDNITNDYQRYVAERKSYSLINPAKAAELVKFLASRHVALIPTMAGWWRMATERRDDFAREDAQYANNPALAYVPEDTRKIWATSLLYKLTDAEDLVQVRSGYRNVQEILRQHYKAGGKVLAGSDTFISIPGLSLQRELLFLVDSGFTPLQAISIATHDNAQFLRKDKGLGTIAPGKLADILVVSANPLEDIRNTQRVAMLLKNGEVMDITYHGDYSIPTPRPSLTRPLWIERQLQNEKKPNATGNP